LKKKFDAKLKRISFACDKSAKDSILKAMAMVQLFMCTTDAQRKA